MYLLNYKEEGFQSSHGCNLDTYKFGKNVWLCPTVDASIGLLSDKSLTIGSNDSVCYLREGSSTYYTCYKRPPGTSFDINSGVYVENTSLDDSTPRNIETDLSQVCNEYNGENGKFVAVYKSTLAYQGIINSALNNVFNTISQLSNISTTKCSTAKMSGRGATDSRVAFCSKLSDGIDIFKTLPQMGDTKGLSAISTAVYGITGNMNNYYTNSYQQGYNGFKC